MPNLSEDLQDLFIDPLQVDRLNKLQSWFANLTLVSVLPTKLYEKLQPKPFLKQTSMKLTADGGTSIQPISSCQLTCTAPDSSITTTIEFYVTPQPILGLTGCVELQACVPYPRIIIDKANTTGAISHCVYWTWSAGSLPYYST